MNKAGAEGYVRLYRSFTDWEWYQDHNCFRVFMHLLLTVNWKPGRFCGHDVPTGTRITSIGKLAEEVGLSRLAVMRVLETFKTTGEVNTHANNKWTAITLVNWAKYQGDGVEREQQKIQRPNNGRTTAEQRANTIEEGKKGRREEVDIEARREKFKSECKSVIESEPDRLHPDLRKAFFTYWTESDQKGLMRFEAQKHFEIPLRMDTWQRNAKAKGEIPKEPGVWNPRA
jgi:DNA-binding transcriptional regulator YhcF (GntR family)